MCFWLDQVMVEEVGSDGVMEEGKVMETKLGMKDAKKEKMGRNWLIDDSL